MRAFFVTPLFLLAVSAAHADYNVDARLGLETTESEQNSYLDAGSFTSDSRLNSESQRLVAQAEVYLGRVDTDHRPLGEAGFLAKLSKIHVEASLSEGESTTRTRDRSMFGEVDERYSLDHSAKYLNASYEWVGSSLPIIAGVGASYASAEGESYLDFGGGPTIHDDEQKTKGWEATLGYYYGDTGRISYTYGESDSEHQLEGLGIDFETETKRQSLQLRHLFPVFAGQHLGTRLQYTRNEAVGASAVGRVRELELVYYPMNRLGLGVGHTRVSADSRLSALFAEYYVTELVSLNARYAESDSRDDVASSMFVHRSHRDGQTWLFEISARL